MQKLIFFLFFNLLFQHTSLHIIHSQTNSIILPTIIAVTSNSIANIRIEIDGNEKHSNSYFIGGYYLTVPHSNNTIQFEDFANSKLLEIKNVCTDGLDIYLLGQEIWNLSLIINILNEQTTYRKS